MTHSSGVAHKRWWPVPAGSTATSPGASSRTLPAAPPKRTLARPRANVRKNAVAPHIAPAVCAKGALDDALRAWPEREIDGAAIDQQRQARIVGDGSVVAKHQRERLGGSARYGHGLDPSGFAPAL